MKQSPENNGNKRWKTIKMPVYICLSVILWLLLWQLLASKLNKSVLLPYPKEVLSGLSEILRSETFFPIVTGSLLHIAEGFGLALAAGIVLAVICHFSDFASALMQPFLKLVKTVPVVSFIILLLLWVDVTNINIVISFLIVLPVVYQNVLKGIRETPAEMIETAEVFRFPALTVLRYLFVPNAVPYASAAVSVGLGMCWKAGIAAEIIALSRDSVGRQLYDAKLYLDTPGLFAWTIVLIVVSILMEWVVTLLWRVFALCLSEPTLRYRKREALRFLLGRPVGSGKGTESDSVDSVSFLENDAPAGNLSVTAEVTKDSVVTDETEGPCSTDAADRSADVRSDFPNGEPESQVDKQYDGEPELILTQVGKQYDGKPVLQDISLTLRRGDVLLITAPSGWGKTTLLRCMLGLTEPDTGTIVGREALRKAAVFQENRLCEGFSALTNVRLAGTAFRRQMPDAKGTSQTVPMRKTDEELLRDLAELGIEEGRRKPVREFSGGMKRRTAWLRALYAQANLLVLDEPFTGLDNARKDLLLNRLKQVQKNSIIAIVTHNTSEIEKIYATFDNIIRFNGNEK